MTINRSQIVSHPNAPDIEYRVTRHQPYKPSPGESPSPMVPDGDPYPVVELYHRDSFGELKQLARFNMDQFIELNREVVMVGKELCPKIEAVEVTA